MPRTRGSHDGIGGILVAIALMVEPGKEHSPFRVQAGELRGFFKGWEIPHHREGADASHRAVAEIAARRPNSDTIQPALLTR